MLWLSLLVAAGHGAFSEYGWFNLGVTRAFWLVVGLLALALAALGAVLPLLPTTVFVIIAAFAFGKSSPRLQAWLENNKVFGPIIADWRTNGAIAPRFKAVAMLMMIGALTFSMVMGVPTTVLIIQAVAISAAAAFILTRPNHGRSRVDSTD